MVYFFSIEKLSSKRPLERLKLPPEFLGKNIVDLNIFDIIYRAYFEATVVIKVSYKIRVIIIYLINNPRIT